MIVCILLATIFVSTQASWLREDEVITSQKDQLVQVNLSEMVGSSYSQWGYGINDTMKSNIIKLINQGQAYHGSDYEKHATYISTELSKMDGGYWNVLLVPNMKLKNSSDKGWRGFGTRFWAYDSKYAILYEECQYMNKLSHIIAKRGASSSKYLSSRYASSNMESSLLTVVNNVLKTLANTTTLLYSVYSESTTKMQEYNQQKWSCVAMDFSYNNEYIDAYGVIYNYYPQAYAAFQNTIKLQNGNGVNVLIWQQ